VTPEARTRRSTLVGRAKHGASYALLFVLLLLTYLVVANSGTGRAGRVISAAMYIGVLLLALRISHTRGRFRRSTAAAAVLGTIVIAALSEGDRAVTGAVHLYLMALLITAIVAILRQGLTYEEVRLEAVAGVLCIYVMLGLAFSSLYIILDAFVHHPWLMTAAGDATTKNQTYYFSFTTLTTLGYGDITAATNVGRTLATIEAILSQVFLASVVALVVTRFGAAPARRENKEESG
jgi:ion channel